MHIELINTGTELLLGDTINTNAAWLGQRLSALGLTPVRQTVVPDGMAIMQAVEEAARRSDVLILTGGLGPTNDDLSRECTAELLDLPLELNAEVMAHLEGYFSRRNKPVNEATKRQAMVPRGAVVLHNPHGTAPGLYVPPECGAGKGLSCAIFLTPGPPREFKPMIENEVEPRLIALRPSLKDRSILYLKVTGMGESEIVERVEKQLESITDLELGYCIGRGDVDVRLSGKPSAVTQGREVVMSAIGDYVMSENRKILEEVIVDLLREKSERVALAESCTGGMIANRLTDVSGASAVLGYGCVTYSNEAKTRLVGVPAELIAQHGAVSQPVAAAMAEGALGISGADHALAATGIAGPTGGTEEKPVGTVFVALASRDAPTEVCKLFFPAGRDRFKLLTSQAALEMLRRRLRGLPIPI
jgi:nicotinamide-nucleotide amidase